MNVKPVGLGRGWDRGKPPVKDSEFRHQRFIDHDMVRLEPAHDGPGHVRVGHGSGVLDESVHRRRAEGGVVGSEELFANGLEGVTRVRVDQVGLVGEEDAWGVPVGSGDWVGFGSGNAVDIGVEVFHPSKHVVEGAVFHD